MGRKVQWGAGGKTIAIYITQEQSEILEKTARAEQTTVSEIVRRALRRYFLPDDSTDNSAIRDSA